MFAVAIRTMFKLVDVVRDKLKDVVPQLIFFRNIGRKIVICPLCIQTCKR